MKNRRLIPCLVIFAALFSCSEKVGQSAPSKDKNVFLITLDGLRWQEVFTGADSSLISNIEYVDDTSELLLKFWNADPNVRRRMLMPFFWSEIESQGILLGNRIRGNKVNVTNSYWFSYPGYSEILTGFADENINSNDKIPNPNKTVLEFVNEQSGFENKVAVFGSWDVFPYIINEQRSGVYVNAGFEAVTGPEITAREELLNILQEQIPKTWSTVRVDAFTHHYALEYIQKNKPRLLYIAYGETDDFAHDGRYDQYLLSANRTDSFIKELWEIINNDPYYSGNTSILITTDHGRGSMPIESWRSHGTSIPGADQIWMAGIGANIVSEGESISENQIYQSQVAATVAALLDLDYQSEKETGPVITEIVK